MFFTLTLGDSYFPFLAYSCFPITATSLVYNINMDNSFAVYLSSADNVLGNLVGQVYTEGVNYSWPTTITNTVALNSGTNYLHVVGTNVGGPAGFLGSFQLTDAGYKFSNGGSTLGTNTTNWTVTNSQPNPGTFATPTVTPTSYGVNGIAPWGGMGIQQPTAQWIWSNDTGANGGFNTVYFSTKISANSPAPEPSTYALMGIGGLLIAFRMKNKAGMGSAFAA